jgi:hypothetical protein
MATDYHAALLQHFGDRFMARDTTSYARLVETWEQPDAIPSQATLDADYVTFQTAQATRAIGIAYLQTFYANREAIGGIFMTFSEGFRTAGASPTLAQYRVVLSDTLVKVYALPTAFVNEFDTERVALTNASILAALATAPNYASALTVAQCGQWHNFLGNWIGRVMAGAAIAISVR